MTTGTIRFAIAALIGALPLAVAPPAQAQTAAKRAYNASELNLIYSLTYQSSQAQAALARQYSAKLNQQKKAIDAKDAELGAARRAAKQSQASLDTLERELATLKQGFTAELAAKDSDFARERQNLEAAANDLLKTSEGKRALEIYLAGGPGSAEAAIEILQRVTAKRNAADKRATAELGLDARDKGRLTTGYVVKLYEDVVAADPGTHWDWVELTRLCRAINNLDRASFAAEQAIRTASDERERSIGLNELGYVLLDRSDLIGALQRFQEGLTIRRAIVRRDASPFNQRDLSVSLDNVAEVFVLRKDFKRALLISEESLQIARMLIEYDPLWLLAKRDLAVSLNKIGGILVSINELNNALIRYEESLKLRREIAQIKPSLNANRDISVSLDSIGDIFTKSGKIDKARFYFEESLKFRIMIANNDRLNSMYQRDILVSLYKLAYVKSDKYNWNSVLSHLETMNARGQLAPRDFDNFNVVRKLAAAEAASSRVK